MGASGFIGSNFKAYMTSKGVECLEIDRNYNWSKKENLGHVIYAIGLTADFRKKPLETVKAHVTKLVETLENAQFESFLYLSSTRVYSGCANTFEDASLTVNPNNFSDLYNISKLMGESVCLSFFNPKIRIARLSNVLGNDFKSDNFITSLIRDLYDKQKIILETSPYSEKDYIYIEDVVKLLALIAERGKERIYNVASGFNMPNIDILNIIKKRFNCSIETDQTKPLIKFTPISIKRLRDEFNYTPDSSLLDVIENIVGTYKQYNNDKN
jgi:nucleoside-diphosphate-sugar epimerase